jgi:hypothetical protein
MAVIHTAEWEQQLPRYAGCMLPKHQRSVRKLTNETVQGGLYRW